MPKSGRQTIAACFLSVLGSHLADGVGGQSLRANYPVLLSSAREVLDAKANLLDVKIRLLQERAK